MYRLGKRYNFTNHACNFNGSTFNFSDPCMTVIGTMPSLEFIKYLFKSLSRQNDVVSYGRVQIFAVMRPGDYVVS